MSLNWDLKGIKDFGKVCFEHKQVEKTKLTEMPPDAKGKVYLREIGTGEFEEGDYMTPLCHAIILATMGVGMPGIPTQKDVYEFCERLNILQKLNGAFLMGTDEATGERVDISITREDVEKFVGLKVNVSYEYRAEWVNRLFEQRERWRRIEDESDEEEREHASNS